MVLEAAEINCLACLHLAPYVYHDLYRKSIRSTMDLMQLIQKAKHKAISIFLRNPVLSVE